MIPSDHDVKLWAAARCGCAPGAVLEVRLGIDPGDDEDYSAEPCVLITHPRRTRHRLPPRAPADPEDPEPVTATLTRTTNPGAPMTNPGRTLAAIIGVAEQLTANLGAHMGVELALAPDVLRAGALDSGGRSSDIPDPTGTIATTLTSRGHLRDTTSSWPEFLEDAERVLVILRRMQTRQATCIRQDPDVARDADATARALRCDGSVDPLCTRNAVKGGLCHACIKRRQRAAVDAGGHVSPDLLETANVEARDPDGSVPSIVSGTCGRCGASFTGSDPDAVAGQLARHHHHGCPA